MKFLEQYPLSPATKEIFERAANEASSRGIRILSEFQLMITLCQEPAISKALVRAGIDPARYCYDLAWIIKQPDGQGPVPVHGLSEVCRRYIQAAIKRIDRLGKEHIDPIDLFLTIINDPLTGPTLVLQHRGHNVKFLYDISLVVALPA